MLEFFFCCTIIGTHLPACLLKASFHLIQHKHFEYELCMLYQYNVFISRALTVLDAFKIILNVNKRLPEEIV